MMRSSPACLWEKKIPKQGVLDIGFSNNILILDLSTYLHYAISTFPPHWTYSILTLKYWINFCILSLKVKEWLQNLGIGEHMPVVHDEDEADDVNVPPPSDDNSIRNR